MKFTVATQKVKYYCTPKIPDDMRRNESDLEGEKLVKIQKHRRTRFRLPPRRHFCQANLRNKYPTDPRKK